jgi:hypothetical protein
MSDMSMSVGIGRGIPLHAAAHPRLVSCVVAAVVSGSLAMAAGMAVTKRLIGPPPAVMALPAAPRQVGTVPLPTVPGDRGAGEATPGPVVAPQPAPDGGATSDLGMAHGLAGVAAPTAMPADRPAEIAVAPGPATPASVSHASRLPVGIHTTPHAAVLALLEAMAHGKSGMSRPRHAAKAGNGAADHLFRSAQLPAATAMPIAVETRIVHLRPGPGGLGGAAMRGKAATGLNGTEMRHRP